MPTWEPKPGMAAHFNLADEFVALITGDDDWSWLTPWAYLLGVPFFETAAFCAQGPGPTLEPISILDFVTPTIGDGHLADKIGRIARDRVFGAFCQLPQALDVVGWSDYVCRGGTTTVDFQNFGILAIPAGATKVRVNVTVQTGHVGDGATIVTCAVPFAGGTVLHGWDGVVGHVYEYDLSLGSGSHGIYMEWRSAGMTATECYSFYGPGLAAPLEHIPTSQPPVIGALPPNVRTYSSIADLGVELDHQEDKLDQIRQTLAFLVQIQATPDLGTDAVDPGSDLPTTDPVDVPPGAIAAVVTISSIPSSSNVELLEPQRYSRVGRITLGTSDGWLPSLAIEHNPQLVVPLPPWVKLIRVSVYPPATAAVRFLTKL